jgi:hypothetical protein
MISGVSGKAESIQTDPNDPARLLEVELLEKRVAWKRATSRYRFARALSFFFLFIVVLIVAGAFFFLFSHAKDAAANRPNSSATSQQQRP